MKAQSHGKCYITRCSPSLSRRMCIMRRQWLKSLKSGQQLVQLLFTITDHHGAASQSVLVFVQKVAATQTCSRAGRLNSSGHLLRASPHCIPSTFTPSYPRHSKNLSAYARLQPTLTEQPFDWEASLDIRFCWVCRSRLPSAISTGGWQHI
jgi:hypothetical protein